MFVRMTRTLRKYNKIYLLQMSLINKVFIKTPSYIVLGPDSGRVPGRCFLHGAFISNLRKLISHNSLM